MSRLRPVPGRGTSLRLLLRDERQDSPRRPRVQDLGSDGRLGPGAKAAAGKRDGGSGTKLGQASRTWAFAEAAALVLRHPPAGQPGRARVGKQPGTGHALPVVAPQLARGGYSRRPRGTAFDLNPCLQQAWRGAGEPDASRDGARSRLAPARCAARRP